MICFVNSEIRSNAEGLLTAWEIAEISILADVLSEVFVEIVLLRIGLLTVFAFKRLRSCVGELMTVQSKGAVQCFIADRADV